MGDLRQGAIEAVEARYYHQGENDITFCDLCPHRCRIKPGARGICRVRENREGILYTLNYGYYTALALDPIEKKPLYHYYPGSNILSIGTFGCNFRCGFCQNWEIAQEADRGNKVTPRQLVRWAKEGGKAGSIGVAYTYSEPLMWYEFVLAAAKEVQKAGLKNVLVSNGYLEPAPLKELLPYIDALNIDVKGFRGKFYQQVVKGRLDPVLKTAELAYQDGKHIEITTLLIPGLNDSIEEIQGLVDWVAQELDQEVPLHFSRYFPSYQMNLPPTPLRTLEMAREMGLRKLKHVYLGNV